MDEWDEWNAWFWNIATLLQIAILQIVLIVLKMCAVIDCWAWGWVLAPLWMTAIAYAVFFVVLFFIPWMKERLHGKD